MRKLCLQAVHETFQVDIHHEVPIVFIFSLDCLVCWRSEDSCEICGAVQLSKGIYRLLDPFINALLFSHIYNRCDHVVVAGRFDSSEGFVQ